MWKELLQLFKSEGLCDEAFKASLQMLEDCKGMYDDAVASLRKDGPLEVDIYERDKQINKYERDVRRKIVTHMSVSAKPDINMGLILTAIVIDIERIGDYAKNIAELAASLDAAFDGRELADDVHRVEGMIDGVFEDLISALDESDEDRARHVMETHQQAGVILENGITLLREGKVLSDDSGHAATVTLYLRFLKRMSAHLKNVATSVVNPYYRIGYREKRSD
jgi:phosphate transport system protein